MASFKLWAKRLLVHGPIRVIGGQSLVMPTGRNKMLVKVSKAANIQLDWMVAKAEGYLENAVYGEPVLREGQLHLYYCGVVLGAIWCPTTNWTVGGKIIDLEGIELRGKSPNCYASYPKYPTHHGPTALIAAMRCYVSSKLGDEVEVPDELV